MYIKAYAKINIYLDVLDKRPDGYHNLEMVMFPICLHDSLEVTMLPENGINTVICDHISLKNNDHNLINITLNKMTEVYDLRNKFSVSVHKEIPIGAGLGGGSANAAAIIKAVGVLCKLKKDFVEEVTLAKSIGADVPFCLLNVPAKVTGIGEKVRVIDVKDRYSVLIIMPKQGISTKEAFELSDKITLSHGNISDLIQALETGDDELLAKSMHNSLEEASFKLNPEIKKVKDMLINDGLNMTLMSGSGSSVFSLSKDHKKLQKLGRKYERQGYDVYVTKTLL